MENSEKLIEKLFNRLDVWRIPEIDKNKSFKVDYVAICEKEKNVLIISATSLAPEARLSRQSN